MSPSLDPKRFTSAAKKCPLVRRHDNLARRLVFHPNDGGAIVLERQDGEGAGGKEMLHGFSVMRLGMGHRGHDADLRIAPASRI